MTEMSNYQSDVKTLNDEELKSLSLEIEEAFNVYGDDDCRLPCDDEAEARFWELYREIQRRRIEAMSPEQREHYFARQAEFSTGYVKTVILGMADLFKSADLMKVRNEFDREFGTKIGDTITVNKPRRFL